MFTMNSLLIVALSSMIMVLHSDNRLPALPPVIMEAIQHLDIDENYLLVASYIAQAEEEYRTVLAIMLERLTYNLEITQTFRFGPRNIMGAVTILGWGALLTFLDVYAAAKGKGLLSKCKEFLQLYGAWVIKTGFFVAVLTSLPSIFAEIDYHTMHYEKQLNNIDRLRYALRLRK